MPPYNWLILTGCRVNDSMPPTFVKNYPTDSMPPTFVKRNPPESKVTRKIANLN
jgi:hypothetical protein